MQDNHWKDKDVNVYMTLLRAFKTFWVHLLVFFMPYFEKYWWLVFGCGSERSYYGIPGKVTMESEVGEEILYEMKTELQVSFQRSVPLQLSIIFQQSHIINHWLTSLVRSAVAKYRTSVFHGLRLVVLISVLTKRHQPNISLLQTSRSVNK